MTDARALTDLIEDAVNRGAHTVEQVHREIADLPLDVLERLGLFERTTGDVRRVQDASIGAVYDVIRDVNFLVTKLAGDLLDVRPRAREAAPASAEVQPPSAAGKP